MNGQVKTRIGRSIVLLAFISLFNCTALAGYSGGTGEPNDPYQIATPEDLNDIGNHIEDLNKCFLQTADINLTQFTGIQFRMIGYGTNPFTGIFNGNGYKISNFNYYYGFFNFSYVGMFGHISGPNASIKNVNLIDPNVSGYISVGYSSTRIGSLVGRSSDAKIENCTAQNVNVMGWKWIGGLVGSSNGIISNCYTSGIIYGLSSAGGLVGSSAGEINRCHSSCSVAGDDYIGGLSGYSDSNISDCYSTAEVNAYGDYAGGLAGVGGVITDCYALGNVRGTNYVGGLVGYNDSGGINNSYFLVGAGPNNGYGILLTDSQMKQQASFTGWDFVWETVNGPNDIWAICEGVSYPKLAWEFIAGDSDNDKDVDFADFAAMGLKWLEADTNLYCGGSDLTGDGIVDIEDLGAFLDNWLL